jgi:arylsulfatase
MKALPRASIPALLPLVFACNTLLSSPPGSPDNVIAAHDRAIHVLDVWMRDPHIANGPDGAYYLTGTTAEPNDPRWPADRYNAGLDQPVGKPDAPPSIVGGRVRVWRSENLLNWVEVPSPFSLDQGYWAQIEPDVFASTPRADWRLWAPELLWHEERWIVVHTSPAPVRRGANLAVTRGTVLAGPFTHPMGAAMQGRHDPSVFRDDDGTLYLLWGNTLIAPLKSDLSGFAAEPVRIDPSDRIIGHEGATLRKIGSKYVHFGTAWSTDQMRKGSYNLYYCTADHPLGPYGPRQFAGRFLGHGTPFQDKQGRWWCSAFYNANVPPVSDENVQTRDLGDNAHTINEQGVTLVPLEVRILDNGEPFIRAKDPRYRHPGPDEAQQF